MNDRMTLLDVARQQDPDGAIAKVVEVLNQSNPILQDAPFYPSNNDMGNRVTRRSSLPSVGWSKLNQGVPRSKGGTRQFTDTIGMITAKSETDTRFRTPMGDAGYQEKRWSDAKAFLEALSQEVAAMFFYGDERLEESCFTGVQPRLETASTARTGSQVHKHQTPDGDGTSIYVLDWHEDYLCGIYPKKGGVAGVETDDMGKQLVEDEDGLEFPADVMLYNWFLGLTVKDPRHMGRLSNIDISDAQGANPAAQITTSLTKLINAMPPKGPATRVIYLAQEIYTAFELQIMAKTNIQFTWGDYLGEKTLFFKGAPLRICDAISTSESNVV